MWAARQVALGFAYAIIPVLLVLGSLALALTEAPPSRPPSTPSAGTPTISATEPRASKTPTVQAPTAPAATPSRTAQPTPSTTASASATQTVGPTASLTFTASPSASPTQRQSYLPQPEGCGPLPGWIWGYVVRPGDTLFRIAVRFRTTIAELEQANCKSSPGIFSGEQLWVPTLPNARWGFPSHPKHGAPWGNEFWQGPEPWRATPTDP